MPFDKFYGITEEKSGEFFGFAGFTFDNGVDLIVTVREKASGNIVEGALVSGVWNGGVDFNTYTTGSDGRAFFQITSNTNVSLTTSKECFETVLDQVPHPGNTVILFDVFLEVEQAELVCFNPVPVNVVNFYRWHEMELQSLPLSFALSSCFCNIDDGCFQQNGTVPSLLPNRWNRASRPPFGVKFVGGYDVAFYINFTEATTITASRRLVITDGVKILADDFADLIDDPFSGGTNIYSQFVAPILPNGLYYMALVNDSDQIILVSNPIEYISKDVSTTTAEIKYRNSRNMYNFNYQGVEDFENIVRLPLNVLSEEYPDNEEIYTEVSTRDRVSYLNETNREYTVETFFIDAGAHEATAIALKHDDFKINNISLQKNSLYQITPNRGYPRTKGTVRMIDRVFAKLNSESNN